jgi:hypothetical protein
MHAVVVRVAIKGEQPAMQHLREQVVPRVSQAPGFAAGYWTRKDNTGLSRMSERLPSMIPDSVNLESAEVREVAAHA